MNIFLNKNAKNTTNVILNVINTEYLNYLFMIGNALVCKLNIIKLVRGTTLI